MLRASAQFRNKLAGKAQRFRLLLDTPGEVQLALLRSILDTNKTCEYGARHGFGSIAGYRDYRERVPVAGYEELRPDIERIAEGASEVLNAEPVIAFEETGGSSGGPKLIPYTRSGLDAFRIALLPWLDDLYGSDSALAEGTAYWSISPVCREARHTRGGIPIGLASDAAYFGTEFASDIAGMLSVPASIGLTHDVNAWRWLTTFHLLADEHLSLISVWSPTFLLELLRFARENAAGLAQAIARGESGTTCARNGHDRLGTAAPDAKRARHVRGVLEQDQVRFDRLWPKLGLISCWDQASSTAYANQLREYFPGVRVQGKGLLATEAVSTIPLAGLPFPVLALRAAFYEFMDARGAMHLAEELAVDGEYEIVLTTASGLYRYACGDRVRVRGHAGRTPMLEFIGRAGLVGDMCGEKITEDFVLGALRRIGLRFATLASEASPTRGYVLLLDAAEASPEAGESFAREIDRLLAHNPQYRYARRLQQLAPVRPTRCVKPLDSWIGAALQRGQRLGDIKPPALYLADDWRQTFCTVQ